MFGFDKKDSGVAAPASQEPTPKPIDLLEQIAKLATPTIPFYAYGDNEAAYVMADTLAKIECLALLRPGAAACGDAQANSGEVCLICGRGGSEPVVSREVSEEAFMAGATFILAGNSYADAQSEKARYVTRRAQEKP